MNEDELYDFAWKCVDGSLENVFSHFPEDPKRRAFIYRKMARMLNEIAADLMLEDV